MKSCLLMDTDLGKLGLTHKFHVLNVRLVVGH